VFKAFLARNKELALVAGLVVILAVLFAPIPPALLDLAILSNFALSLTILLLTLYVAKPVDFSTFPSLLLVATLFRLAINIASTRLILTGADAGQVINSIGNFSVSGNFVVGLVVFFILVVVQFIVVTAGAQRVSEVAARFTLDSMPGQQMSIDADLNMGLIDQAEAIRRRATLEKEAAFYGAMDGASKFVKGDAIAGIIIVLINIIAGSIIGAVQMGMTWAEALQRFALLTIGDGIATQIPALVISIATGLIVTRSSADRDLSTELLSQLSSAPRALVSVCAILCVLLLLPGMPKWPIAVFLALGLWLMVKARKASAEADLVEANAVEPEPFALPSRANFQALSLAFGPVLGDAWKDSEVLVLDRIASLRESQERSLGINFPPVRLIDGTGLGSHDYEIRVLGIRYASGQLFPDQMLAIKSNTLKGTIGGVETMDPAYGMPAVWIKSGQAEEARDLGYSVIDPLSVLMTHFGEVVRAEAATLLTRATVVRILEDVRSSQPGLVEELIPAMLSVSDVQRVLQVLISEAVPVGNLELLCEHLVDLARTEKDPALLGEQLRQRMSLEICSRLRDRHPDLAVLSLDPRLENQIQANLGQNNSRDGLGIDARLAEQLIRKLAQNVSEVQASGREPVLLCGSELRRPLKSITSRAIPRLSVLSVREIPANIELRSVGIVRLDSPEVSRNDGQGSKGTSGFSGSSGSATVGQLG
jgi:flagellar biosynthesis protein FlhA